MSELEIGVYLVLAFAVLVSFITGFAAGYVLRAMIAHGNKQVDKDND